MVKNFIDYSTCSAYKCNLGFAPNQTISFFLFKRILYFNTLKIISDCLNKIGEYCGKMVDLNNIPNAPIKIIFAIHFFLCVWGAQGSWSPDSYFFYNLLFFITLMWAIQCKESTEPVEMALFIGVASIILDIIVITIYFPYYIRDSDRFSVGMAILNLLVRPVTCMVLYRVFTERSGSSSSFSNQFGGLFGSVSGSSAQRGPYEDLDSVRQVVPGSRVGLDGSPTSFAPTSFAPGVSDVKTPPPYHG